MGYVCPHSISRLITEVDCNTWLILCFLVYLNSFQQMDSRTGPRIPSPLRFDRRRRVVFFLFSRYLRNLRPSFFRNQLNLAENTISSLPIFFFFNNLYVSKFKIFEILKKFPISFFSFPMRIQLYTWIDGWFTYSCSRVSWDLYPAGSDYIFQMFFFFQQFHVLYLFLFQTMITHIVLLCHVTKVHKVSVLRGLLFYKVIWCK